MYLRHSMVVNLKTEAFNVILRELWWFALRMLFYLEGELELT